MLRNHQKMMSGYQIEGNEICSNMGIVNQINNNKLLKTLKVCNFRIIKNVIERMLIYHVTWLTAKAIEQIEYSSDFINY